MGIKVGGGGAGEGSAGRERLVCRRLAIMIVFPIPTAMQIGSAERTLLGNYCTYFLAKRNGIWAISEASARYAAHLPSLTIGKSSADAPLVLGI